MRKFKIINKLRFFTAIAVFLLLLALTTRLLFQIAGAEDEVTYKVITVIDGDSLWSMAKDQEPKGDIRKYIYQIRKINGLDQANIKVGDRLKLPISD